MAKTGGALFATGIPQLDAKLRRLSFRMQGKILRDSMKAAMQPVLEQAKATMPTDTGYTARRLKIRTSKPKKSGSRTVRVGIFGPASRGRGKAPVATGRIVEFGTTDQQAQFILRRALAARQAEALSTLTAHLRAGVLAAVV